MENIIGLIVVIVLTAWMMKLAHGFGRGTGSSGPKFFVQLLIACLVAGLAGAFARPTGATVLREFLVGSLGFLSLMTPTLLVCWLIGRFLPKRTKKLFPISVLTHAGDSIVRYENGRRIR